MEGKETAAGHTAPSSPTTATHTHIHTTPLGHSKGKVKEAQNVGRNPSHP